MKKLFIYFAIFCYSVTAFCQNHFPELDPPPMNFTGAKKTELSYLKTDSLYSKMVPQPWMVDEYGRHFISNGVVILTEDALGDLPCLDNHDYARMRDMGFNVQVIRLCATRIGAWPGTRFDNKYFEKIDEHIRIAKENGIKTMFKMTLYDHTKEVYGDLTMKQWKDLLSNENGTREKYYEGWSNLFIRYKNEPAVIGYDLLNEPLAAGGKRLYPWEEYENIFKNINDFEQNFFIPFYNKLVKTLNKVSPEKYALIQWWHYVPAEHRKTGFPSARVPEGIKGKNVLYAPHYYGVKSQEMMERYLEDAIKMGVPLIVPEYGAPTFSVTDNDIETQLLYKLSFMESAEFYDRYCVGLVKAWWCGSNAFYEKTADRTWAMFEGRSHSKGPERKYVVDMICRPRPLVVNGVVNSFNYNFARRVFSMDFEAYEGNLSSEIYIPVKRHYQDGCRIILGNIELKITPDFRMVVSKNPDNLYIDNFYWDLDRQRLIITHWPNIGKKQKMMIVPGVQD